MHATRTFSIVTLCLILLAGFPGILGPAAAQQQEKRIALVLGNGAYAKSPLATAANDAGLIAQTLQAAGFDVVGARDLDGDTLRRSFRDFIQKAEASGPGTVAMVYLAGYGMQLAGENYFIPVDSALSRDVDIPIEGLRISDYVRQLASLPLKASIVVLDAARQQPFIAGGQPIASGLALVEPEAHMLVGFNAAPGTVAPNEPGPYGAYAQSLAEMIRTGGLPLPEVFNRVRLRVNEASKGAQVPWNADKIDAPFMFFDRAADAPAPAPADQAAAVRNRPMRDLGARDAYAAAIERDTMQGYDDFLAAYPGDPLSKRVRAIIAARREAITWLRSYRADTPQAYWSYLRRYPRGPHAGDARRRLAILTAPLEPPPAFAVIEYDVPPPPPEEIIYVDRPVLIFSDPEFDFVPPPPPPVFFLPPPPPDFVILAPPPPPVGLFILPQPFFVPIPVYVQAPVYVAPPPNNIIFANIHNTTVINTVINQPQQPPPAAPVGRGDPGALPNAAAPPALPAVRGGAAAPGGVPPVGAGPALPAAAAQKASLIQQGKLPVPPSASINPAIKPAAPGASPGVQAAPTAPTPANVPANALPAPPKVNALPVPGAKGAPPAPPAASGPAPGVPNPGAKGAPPNQPAPPPAAAVAPASPGAGAPKTPLTNAPAPVGTPKAGGAAQAPEAKPAPEAARRPNAVAPPPPPSGPAIAPSRPIPQAAPKPQIEPPVRRAEPSRRVAPPPPPPRPAPQMARPAPPPPRAAPPPPPPRPAPQIARPAPPPPRPAPPPPPPPRPAPQMVRPAPPPPQAAPPPPPRPAPQVARPAPPPPGAAKKCPPNVPKC